MNLNTQSLFSIPPLLHFVFLVLHHWPAKGNRSNPSNPPPPVLRTCKGHITVRTKVWGVNLKKFLENSREAVSVSTICDEYCSSLRRVSAVEMPKSYRRNADEMLFKTDTVCQEADAKTQMLNAVCQKTHAKNQMLKKCKHDLSSNKRTEKVMKYKKTKEKSKYVTAGPSSLKQMNFKMECSSSLLVLEIQRW